MNLVTKAQVINAHDKSMMEAEEDFQAFEEESKHPREINEAVLFKILEDNKDTEYGRKYGFAGIHSVKEYQERVPVVTYKELQDDFDRMLDGEKNVLTAYPFNHMNHTSGTVGKKKLVPLTQEQVRVFLKYNRHYTDGFFKHFLKPSWVEGRTLCLAEGTHYTAPSGISVGSASSKMAEYVNGGADALENMMRYLYTSPIEASIPKPGTDTRYIHIRFALMDRDVTGIVTGFYTILVQFFQYIADNYKMLIHDIETGTIDKSIEMSDEVRESLLKKIEPMPARGAELRNVFKNGSEFPFVPAIWPNLHYLNGVGGAGFAIYDKTIKERFTANQVENIYSGITASEGLWSIPVEKENEDGALVAGSAFMEFLPVDAGDDFSKCVTIDQVEDGCVYELIITNYCGFYRYRMSDAVKIMGYYNKTPRVRFMYRINKTINLMTEKTTEKAMEQAVTRTAEELGFDLSDFTVYPNAKAIPPRYEFLIQPLKVQTDISGRQLRDCLEKHLCEANAGYAGCLEKGTLQKLQAYWLQPETTFLYRDFQIMKGASPAQLKPIRVISNEDQRKFFFCLRDSDEVEV